MAIKAYTEDQCDALQEVTNIAMGQAADSLATILGNFVELSVPRIMLVDVNDIEKTVAEMVNTQLEISAARQAFFSALRGESIVIFSQGAAEALSDLMGYESELDTAARQELLLEITNLLGGAIINGISEILETELSFSAPSLIAENVLLHEVLKAEQLHWSHALLLEVNFNVENRDIRCHQLMLMTEETIDTLRHLLDHFLEAL